nr:hypothetical protein HK105_000469 [Polyrhizophydium stewartii]
MAAIPDASLFGKDSVLPPIGRTGSHNNLVAADLAGGGGGGGGAATQPAGGAGLLGEDTSYSSKLTNVEAQRIMAVLQELQRKVYLIGLLPDVMDRRVSTVFGGETFNIIKDYRLLEQRYKSLIDTHDRSEAHLAEIREAAKTIRTSTRSLTRHFIQNSGALAKLRYLKSTKSPVVAQFEHLLQEIKMLVYGRLKTTVEEEKAKQDQLAIIIAKEQKTSNEVKALKEELEKAKKERMGEINKRNEVIRRLKDELREIKHQAEEATKKLESRSKQKEEADLQNFHEKEDILHKDIISLEKQLETDTANNREEEALLRKKKFKIESEVENWIHKYDQDMEEKQAEIDDITAIFMEEKAHLDELQARYADLQKEYEKIIEDKRIAEEQKKEKERELQRATEAAVKIQAVFRGFLVRRDIARKKPSEQNEKPGKKDKGKGKAKK